MERLNAFKLYTINATFICFVDPYKCQELNFNKALCFEIYIFYPTAITIYNVI